MVTNLVRWWILARNVGEKVWEGGGRFEGGSWKETGDGGKWEVWELEVLDGRRETGNGRKVGRGRKNGRWSVGRGKGTVGKQWILKTKWHGV